MNDEILPHVFAPNNAVVIDYKGTHPCLVCEMPEGNKRVHVDKLPDDAKSWAAGEERGGE